MYAAVRANPCTHTCTYICTYICTHMCAQNRVQNYADVQAHTCAHILNACGLKHRSEPLGTPSTHDHP